MTEPGILPPPPPINPIKHISPSRFMTSKSCILKGIWEGSNKDISFLPPPPSAALGKVIHNIMECAGKGGMAAESDFEKVWASIEKREEEKLLVSWTEKQFVPLSNSIRNYSEKKELCRLTVQEILGLGKDQELQSTSGQQTKKYHEEWLKTPDGVCIGRADYIKEANDFIEIIDYKSVEKIEPERLEDYKVQLKLYAAIFHAERREWPSSLKIMLISGRPIEIEFTQDECKELLKEVYELFYKVNSIINKKTSENESLLSELAKPSPNICHFCSFRPVCTPYWNARKSLPNGSWPNDIYGTIEESGPWGKDRIYLKLKTLDCNEEIKVINLLPKRHPGLEIGSQKVSIFSLIKDKNKLNFFKEGASTVIYAIS